MTLLTIAIAAFCVLESLNILLLYMAPESARGNALGVFAAWERSKADPAVHQLVRYLAYWVAGTKVIMVALLVAILISGDRTARMAAVVALIVSIATFYWRMFPLIREMDAEGQLSPSGYSRTLGIMIGVFIGVFATALAIALAVG